MFPDHDPGGLMADNRGLSIGIMGFVAMIVIAALLYTLLEPAATGIFETSSQQTSNPEVAEAIDLRQQIFAGTLFFALFLAGVALISWSVRESGRVG